VKSSRLILLVIVPFLFSCAARMPEIPMQEVPAEPLMQALERRMRSFATLKSEATLEVIRKERRRFFDNAGVVVKGRDRFRIEAYGPLGQSVAALVWNGRDVLLDLEGTLRVLPGGAGLERLLGNDVDPADLADILAGNVPGMVRTTSAKLRCAASGACLLDLRGKDTTVRVHPAAGAEPADAPVRSCEVFRKGSLLYQVRYEAAREVAGYLLPTRIIVENPDKQVSLTIQYAEPEVNVPVDESDFQLPGGEG
jgi:hypothetical protein